MEKKDLRDIFKRPFAVGNWNKILVDVFHAIDVYAEPQQFTFNDDNAKYVGYYNGRISTPNGDTVGLFSYSSISQVRRKRVSLRNLVSKLVNPKYGSFDAVLVAYYDDKEWRISYICDLKDNITSAKRFSFLVGDSFSEHNTAVSRLSEIKKGFELSDLYEAFSVERLTKDFFNEYTAIYKDFCSRATDSKYFDFDNFDDKQIRDYVKLLLGRILFLCFVQKKGWMNGDKQFLRNIFNAYCSQLKSGEEFRFLDNVLEKIFFECLNNEHSELFQTIVKGYGDNGKIDVPFLNGGLFECKELDVPRSVFGKDLWQNLFDLLDKYNFTIDENDPTDAEVGIDPEMLGKIFESQLEDNKDKGAFYTPKEIVSYMCKESLIAYLEKSGVDKEELREYVQHHELNKNWNKETTEEILTLLKEIKVCDPAIGSGAFPMGMLREILDCRLAIESYDDIAKIKREIIQTSIYGVDIEAGAVDIARLRFWLSIVVDSDKAEPLPNLDYKIMQGNSLLESYEGIDLSGMTHDEQLKKSAKEKNARQYQLSLTFNEEDALKNIQDALRIYYSTDNHDKKAELRDSINSDVKTYIINLKGGTDDIKQKMKDLPIPNNQFFLWHIYFKDVFDKGGFDVVIGNPPYNELRDLSKEAQEAYKKSNYHKYAKGGRINMFQYFYPLGTDMCNQDGIICLITQNSLLAEDSALENRKLLFEKTSILSVDSYPERDDKNKRVFESAKMSVCFCVLRKNTAYQTVPINITIWNERQMLHSRKLRITKTEIIDVFQEDLTLPICDQTQLNILVKMRNKSDDSVYNISAGEIDMTKYKSNFSYEPSSDKTRIITGAQVLRYHITDTPSQGGVKYVPSSCLSFSNNRLLEVNAPRLVMQRITGVDSKIRLIATLLPKGMCCANSTNYISSLRNTSPLKVLLAILNSTAANYIFKATSTNTNVTSKEISKIPIPSMNEDEKEKLSEIVDRILSAKKLDPLADTTAEEREIDRLVYELYGLTEEEIKIVEGKNE